MSKLKTLETAILHAGDVIFWLDGTSADTTADMLRLAVPLDLQLTIRPRDLQIVHGRGKTAFIRRDDGKIIDGIADETDRQRTTTPTFALAGIVSDPTGRHIPRRFAINAGNGIGHGLALYPSPLGTRFGPAGGLLGTLRFSDGTTPVPWALLTIVITTALGAELSFRCQANGKGDFMLSLNRLPPLPKGVDNYSAELSIAASADADPDTPLDPADLTAMNLGDINSDNTFSSPIELTIIPGEIRLIRSSNKDYLAVQPS